MEKAMGTKEDWWENTQAYTILECICFGETNVY